MTKRLAIAACGVVALLALGTLGVRAVGLPRSASAAETCGVGLAGTTYLLRLTGPHARAHCAADVKNGKPLNAYWSTRTGEGLVLLCQARYLGGLLAQIYAGSRDDFYGRLGCSLQTADVHKGKAHAIAPHHH